MAEVVSVCHSADGHSQRMAQALAEGAEAKMPDAADALIMGLPAYMGGVSRQFKKFADASSGPW